MNFIVQGGVAYAGYVLILRDHLPSELLTLKVVP